MSLSFTGFYCLSVRGPLCLHTAELLVELACRIYQKRDAQAHHRDGSCEVTVRTERKEVCLGGVIGIEFVGDVEHEPGTAHIHYLVPYHWLEQRPEDARGRDWAAIPLDRRATNAYLN